MKLMAILFVSPGGICFSEGRGQTPACREGLNGLIKRLISVGQKKGERRKK